MNNSNDRSSPLSRTLIVTSIIVVIMAIIAIILAWAGRFNVALLNDSIWQDVGLILSFISVLVASSQAFVGRKRILKKKKKKKKISNV